MDILIVDDHATNRKLLRAQLEAEGHAILEAADGVEALAVLERESVDGVVSDILMPNMDGYRFCREVRQNARFSALPFIFYTSSFDSVSDRQLAKAVGADDYFLKPSTPADLLHALIDPTQKPGVRDRQQSQLPDEVVVLSKYSDVLVAKLEETNTRLLKSLEELRMSHEEILKLNQGLEQRVAERTALLVAANKELDSFSYSISHDLRSPLRTIEGYSRIVLEDFSAPLAPEGKVYLQKVRDHTQQMGLLIDKLLKFARFGRQAITKQPVNTDKLVRRCLAEMTKELQGRKMEIVIGEMPACQGDSTLLNQVWTNLLSNAIKYTRKQQNARIEIGYRIQPRPAVDGQALASESADTELVYFVKDNGAGFDMKNAGRLFGDFQRLHSAADYEGTGVGLAVVQRIVQRHGGRIWADARPNQGATFSFTLA